MHWCWNMRRLAEHLCVVLNMKSLLLWCILFATIDREMFFRCKAMLSRVYSTCGGICRLVMWCQRYKNATSDKLKFTNMELINDRKNMTSTLAMANLEKPVNHGESSSTLNHIKVAVFKSISCTICFNVRPGQPNVAFTLEVVVDVFVDFQLPSKMFGAIAFLSQHWMLPNLNTSTEPVTAKGVGPSFWGIGVTSCRCFDTVV